MQVTMTERDKKLIVMLSIIVIVVSIGYWGILPALKAASKAQKDIAEEQELKDLNDMKIARIPVLKEQIEDNYAKQDELKKNFFPMMNSEQIDKRFTGLVLERGLFAFDLGINIDPTPLALSPYQFSEDEEEADSESDYSDFADDQLFGDPILEESASASSDSSNVNENVYCAHISMRIGGSKEELLGLIDDLAAYQELLLITGYSWSESTYVEPYAPAADTEEEEGEETFSEENTEEEETEIPEPELPEGAYLEEDAGGMYLVIARQVLELNLDIYMYNDSETTQKD